MTDIVLSTLNARYANTSMGLRCLLTNLQENQKHATIEEFTIHTPTNEAAEQILSHQPHILGLGLFIWNVEQTLALVRLLKALSPELKIVIGGPEISFETESQPFYLLADYIITGQGEIAFRQLCEQILSGQKPLNKIIVGGTVPLDKIALPYDAYTDIDLAHRTVYVEASRGCPFKCEFCLSALDKTAYPVETDRFLSAMDDLWQRGLRQYKFVDRTFNLKISKTIAILDFFLERISSDNSAFLHFELIPDHLPNALKEKIKDFPPGSLQFEIGIQSFNPEVQQLINRRQNNKKTCENIAWLRNNTSTHLHTDLIFGLPGETLESFAEGFDKLVGLNPQEIQLGILKRLRGTPIIRHDESHNMVYDPNPPYSILSNKDVSFVTVQRIQRMARYWDLIANSGRFKQSLPLLLGDSPFYRFLAFSDWLYKQGKQTHKIALPRLYTSLHEAGLALFCLPKAEWEQALLADYQITGQKGAVPFLPTQTAQAKPLRKSSTPPRQQRHLR